MDYWFGLVSTIVQHTPFPQTYYTHCFAHTSGYITVTW